MGVEGRHPVLSWALAPLPRFCCVAGVRGKPLLSGSRGPEPAGGEHLRALRESSWARTARPRRQPWAPLPPRPRIEAPRPGFDLSLTAWLGNFLRLLFLQRRGAWSAGEPVAAGTAARPQEGAPARGCGPSPGLGSAAAGRAGGGGSSSTRCSGSILQIPRSSKLHHSGNDDSVRIIQAPASLSSPSPPYLFGDFTIA